MWILVLLIVVIIGLFALGFWQTARAKRQHETVTALSPARVRAIIDDSFGKLFWAPASGPGQINMQRRTPNGSGATISVDITSTADGKTHVQSWMSAWRTRYGMVASGGWQMAKKIVDRIDQAPTR
ncbi:MAG TPA: hypothetical protein VGM70_08110 [Pseudolysinimonas sp.]|jgi:hypothetical protein